MITSVQQPEQKLPATFLCKHSRVSWQPIFLSTKTIAVSYFLPFNAFGPATFAKLSRLVKKCRDKMGWILLRQKKARLFAPCSQQQNVCAKNYRIATRLDVQRNSSSVSKNVSVTLLQLNIPYG